MSRAPRAAKFDEEAPPESDCLEGAPHPRDVYQLSGHREAEQLLLDAFNAGRMAQSWIIGGRQGIGKATLAWRFARFLMANPQPHPEGHEPFTSLKIDEDHPAARKLAAMAYSDVFLLRREWNYQTKKHYTEIRVDDVRRMTSRFHQSSAESGWRVAIIDCAEDLNSNSANALLKLIEEPPPRSLFMFIAHRPAQMLATLRSRSRTVLLQPLAEADIVEAVSALGEPWSNKDAASIRQAAERAGGSVRDALRMLSGSGVKILAKVEAILNGLAKPDWRAVHELADAVAARENESDYEAVIGSIFDWIDNQTRKAAASGAHPVQLAPLAEVWEKTASSVRETESLNLDRKLLILNIINDLAGAVSRPA